MIDWNKVESLKDEIGADDLETSEDIERSYHALKGSALNLGFTQFAEFCKENELASATPPHSASDVLSCYTKSKDHFMTVYKSQNAPVQEAS